MAKKKASANTARISRLLDAEIPVDLAQAVLRDAVKALGKCEAEGVAKMLAEINQMLKKLAKVEASLIKKREKLEENEGADEGYQGFSAV
jgi:hypothetical protein